MNRDLQTGQEMAEPCFCYSPSDCSSISARILLKELEMIVESPVDRCHLTWRQRPPVFIMETIASMKGYLLESRQIKLTDQYLSVMDAQLGLNGNLHSS